MELILTDIQILGMLMCAALAFIAYRVRIPPLAIVPSIGFYVIGFQIYDQSEDPLILVLFIMTAIVSFVICFRSDNR